MSNIEHPQHYNGTKYEVWDVLDAWFPTNPLLWNVGKYLARADRKGAPVEDLKKAKAYLEREIARRETVHEEIPPEPELVSIYAGKCAQCGGVQMTMTRSRSKYASISCHECGANYEVIIQ